MASRFVPLPTTWLTTLVYASLLIFPLAAGVVCPVTESPVLEQKVIGSEVVVQGRVRRQVKADPKDTIYTAEVEVQCVFKGGPVSAVINVLEAGWKEGRCMQTELTQGQMYLLYLRPDSEAGLGSKDYLPVFAQDPAERRYLDELRYACNLNVQLPIGLTQNQFCDPDDFALDYDCPELETTTPVSAANPITSAIGPTLFLLTCWALSVFL